MDLFDEATVTMKAAALQVFDEAVATDKAANMAAMPSPKWVPSVRPSALSRVCKPGLQSWMGREARMTSFASLHLRTTLIKSKQRS